VNTDTGSDIKDLHGCMQIISCYTPGCGCTADLCCCICTGPAARRCETPLPPPACPAGGGGAARAPHARPPARRPAAQEPFAGEERRLALLAALLLPLRAAEAPGKKKGARAPATAHVVREACMCTRHLHRTSASRGVYDRLLRRSVLLWHCLAHWTSTMIFQPLPARFRSRRSPMHDSTQACSVRRLRSSTSSTQRPFSLQRAARSTCPRAARRRAASPAAACSRPQRTARCCWQCCFTARTSPMLASPRRLLRSAPGAWRRSSDEIACFAQRSPYQMEGSLLDMCS